MKEPEIEKDIQTTGKTAPRITPQHIESVITNEVYFTAADGVRGATPPGLRTSVPRESHKLLTFCVLELENGYTVTGESACASPENFDEEIGRKIARKNAINKIWPLEGYILKQSLTFTGSVVPWLEKLLADPAKRKEMADIINGKV